MGLGQGSWDALLHYTVSWDDIDLEGGCPRELGRAGLKVCDRPKCSWDRGWELGRLQPLSLIWEVRSLEAWSWDGIIL